MKLVEARGAGYFVMVQLEADLQNGMRICLSYASIQGGGLSSIFGVNTRFVGHPIQPMSVVLYAFPVFKDCQTTSVKAV